MRILAVEFAIISTRFQNLQVYGNMSRIRWPRRLSPEVDTMMTQLITLKSLPWDLLLGITWVASCFVHIQLVLESVVFECGAEQHGPRWFQGASLTSFLGASDELSSGHAAVQGHLSTSSMVSMAYSASADQCSALLSYPCHRGLAARFMYCMSNWSELSAVVLKHPALTQLLQLAPAGMFCLSAEACHVLLALLAYSIVHYRRWKSRQAAASPAAVQSSTYISNTQSSSQIPADHQQAKLENTGPKQAGSGSFPASADLVPSSIAVVPVALAQWRTWLIAFVHISEPTALLLTLLLCPPSREMLQFSWSYNFGSVARNYFAAVQAMDCIMATVSYNG